MVSALMGQTEEQVNYLAYLTEQGMYDRYAEDLNGQWGDEAYDEIKARIKEELRVITKQGFTSYFLMVADITKFCRDNGIPLGPARGSAGGSVVSYCLGIIAFDPLKFDLVFERFLNDERVENPDIDVDLCWHRRQEVIDYVAKKYGDDYVAQIVTFGTLSAKSLIDDLGRVLKITKADTSALKKLIPATEKITLQELAKNEEFMAKLHEVNEREPRLVPAMFKLEGLHRHGSMHAGGVVVANRPILDIAPTYLPPKAERQIVQYEMKDAASVGLLKMDLLGLRTVTMVDWAEKDVRKHENPDFYTATYGLEDQAAFDIINRGDTVGIFQLEGTGITRFAQEMHVESFNDIVALLALFRPGTLDSGAAQQYIDRKNGKEKVSYPHPDLEPILNATYGVMVYQEQVMAILRRMGGFSMGEADVMRRAIGSKDEELMETELAKFRQACLDNGYDAMVTDVVVDLIRTFARYGFNKSHAVAYGHLTYWTAVIKARYPAAFYSAWLNVTDAGDKRGWIIDNAARRKIKILPPSVNKSDTQFTMINSDTIMFGIGAVKGMGASFVNRVMAFREANGEFEDYWHFCRELTSIPKDKKEALVGAGAFDFDDHGRAFLYKHSRDISDAAKKSTNDRDEYYASLEPAEPMKLLALGELEKQYVNFYITADPIKLVQNEVIMMGGVIGREFTLQDVNKEVLVGGRIGRVHTMKTKKGGTMAFIDVDDGQQSYSVTLFPEVFRRVQAYMVQDNFTAMKCEISSYKGLPSLQAVAVFPVDIAGRDSDVIIDVGQGAMDLMAMAQLSDILDGAQQGNSRVMLWVENHQYRFLLKADLYNIVVTDDMIAKIKLLFGKDSVSLQGRE